MGNEGRRPVVLIVRDGWGENPYAEWNHANAIHLARTPVDDALRIAYPHALIHTSGEDVGLPVGIMGNSEVGHQNIGAGRIVDQELLRLSKMVRSGELYRNEALSHALARTRQRGGSVHLMGLASDAGVHSSLDHLFGLVEMCRRQGMAPDKVFVHNFSDGRDSPPRSGLEFCQRIEKELERIGVGRVASVIGRFYAMDRDLRWPRVEKAYRLLTEGIGTPVRSASEAYQRFYEHPTDATRQGDEFIEPMVVVDEAGAPLALVRDGDLVIFYNFRGDRPRELCRAFCLASFPYQGKGRDGQPALMGFPRVKLDIDFVTLTEYEQGLPVTVAIPKPPKMAQILGACVSDLGLRQFRCAETEKFPHVTFFFNDYREPPFPGEERAIIPSPTEVATYDLKPQMSAPEVTKVFVKRIEQGIDDLMILNFANADMVGHTGSLPAAIAAVEAVDQGVGQVVEAIRRRGGALVVTADHGNAEQMIDPETGGPHTAHTTYDVPAILVDDRLKGKRLREGGRLADLAPTLLALLGIPVPAPMTGLPLFD